MTVDLLNHEEELTRADRKILEFIGRIPKNFFLWESDSSAAGWKSLRRQFPDLPAMRDIRISNS